MLELTLQAQPSPEAFARWADVFRRYLATTSKRADEVVRKKGRDLGIRLYKGFEQHKWGGPGKHPGLAVSEQQARQSGGEGTHVRDRLMEIYRESRSALNFDVRSAGQQRRSARTSGTLDEWGAARDLGDRKRALRRELWQKIVKAELGARQSSIGFQAAAFLMFRRRGGELVNAAMQSRSGEEIGAVRVGEASLEIESRVPHTAETAAEHRIVDDALAASAADMLEYLRGKELAALAEGVGGAA